MRALKQALTPRWLGYLAMAVAFALISAVFGLWQWDRREQAVADIDLIRANYDRPAEPWGAVLPPDQEWEDELQWRQVLLEGEYVPSEQLLARTRPRAGQVGFNVLVPFVTNTGDVVIVDRGWVPTGASRDEPDTIPAPPVGDVDVVVRLFPGEPELEGRGAPEGQVASVALGVIDEVVSGDVDQRAYGQLVSESPSPAVRPLPALIPVPDEGPHLSYSIQWFVFALLGFIAWGYLFVQEYRYGPAVREKKPARKRSADEEFEDSLLDRSEGR